MLRCDYLLRYSRNGVMVLATRVALMVTSVCAHPADCIRPSALTAAPLILPQPLGSLKPGVAARPWHRASRNGITGRLDERHPAFEDGCAMR